MCETAGGSWALCRVVGCAKAAYGLAGASTINDARNRRCRLGAFLLPYTAAY